MRRPWPTGGCCVKNKKKIAFNSDYSRIYNEQKVRNLLLSAALLPSLLTAAMIGSRVVLHRNYERKFKVSYQDVLHAVHVASDKNRSNTERSVENNTKQNNTHMYYSEGQVQTHNPYVLEAQITRVRDWSLELCVYISLPQLLVPKIWVTYCTGFLWKRKLKAQRVPPLMYNVYHPEFIASLRTVVSAICNRPSPLSFKPATFHAKF